MTKKILVVEDQKDIREVIVAQLKLIGAEIDSADSAENAKLKLEKNDYQVLVLDWMLPGISGVELCKELRLQKKYFDLPIIMLTALTQPEDIIKGLDAGADDYVTKPFEMEILQARVRAQLRRTIKNQHSNNLEYVDLKIDNNMNVALIKGIELPLTFTEFKILQTLMEKMNHVFTREQLIEKVSGGNVFVTGRTIDTHMAGLRKKIGIYAENIVTSRGIGYAFKPAE